jgi:uncharacterized membrane protein YfcA
MGDSRQIDKNSWEKSYQTTLIIVLIQIFATIVLIIFGWFFSTFTDNSVSSRAISLLWLSIILLVIASFVLRRVFFSIERLRKSAEQKNLSLALQNNTVFIGLVGVIIAILGFLVATLSGNKFEMLRAGAVSLVVFIFNFPRKSVWQKIIAYLEKG